MLKSGSVHPRPDFSRAIPLVSLANVQPSVVFKINVPGYLFTDLNLSSQINNYPAIGHYLASHPGYFHMGVITGTSNVGGFRRPDYLERIMVYHGINGDATKQYTNRDQIVFIVPGTSTYWQPQFIIPAHWDAQTPHISFVPDLGLDENIKAKDYVTPIYIPSSCLIHNSYEKNRIGMSGNRWVRDIFRGDWRNNFDRDGDTWTLRDPGNIIRNKYYFKGIGGSWGLDNTDWWQTNALDTGKNRVYFTGSSYVLRYITAAEAVAIHNSITVDKSSALGSSRLNRNGTVSVEAKAMTYSDYALLLAERWVVLGNTFSAYGLNDLAEKIMNRSSTWNTQTDVSVSGDVASLTGESSDVKSSMSEFLERTYGNDSVKLDPIDRNPLFSEEDFYQVPTDTTVNWVPTGINTYVLFVSKERGLNDPPSGFGEADFYNNSIKKVSVDSLTPEDVYVLSKDEEGYAYKRVTAGTGDIKTSTGATITAGGTPDSSSDTEYGRNNLKILQHCEWFRGPAGSSAPQYIPGLFSRTEKFDIPTPPNCVNVWNAQT